MAHHVCPWWVGYLLLSPLRKLRENPDDILAPLVRPGMTAVDIGSAMGFFSLPLARMVGDNGRVVCVDLQERMLRTLSKRARRAGVDRVIEIRSCTQESLGLADLSGQADLVLAVHVIHETTDQAEFLQQCHEVMRESARLLVLEPAGHVSAQEFEATREAAIAAGFAECESEKLKRSHSLLLESPST